MVECLVLMDVCEKELMRRGGVVDEMVTRGVGAVGASVGVVALATSRFTFMTTYNISPQLMRFSSLSNVIVPFLRRNI